MPVSELTDRTPLFILLADLAHAGLAVHHTLGPLTPEEAGRLLTGLLADVDGVAPALQQQVVQRAGGVPFFLVSYARGLQTGGDGAIPWDLAQGLRQRVAALPVGAQQVLGVAAVIGRVVHRRLLAAAFARPDDELLAALDAACVAQIVREGGAEEYQFLHDVIREVVEADLGAARRAVLHRRVAEALERDLAAGDGPGVPPVERLAYHYSQGEVWAKALEYLVQAGDKAAAAFAHQDALAFYAQALAVSEKLGDAALPAMLTVTQKRGDIHKLIQHPQEAIGDYGRMAEVARRRGDRYQEGLALVYRGRAEEDSHAFETAEATLRAALRVGDEGFDDVRQLATAWLAHTLIMAGRKADAESFLREARERARLRGDLGMEHAVNGLIGLIAVWDGRYEDALASTRYEAELVDAESPVDRCGNLWGMSLTWGALGEFQVALSLLQECLALGERVGEVWARRRTLNTLGWIYGELQDHQRALEWSARGVEAAREQLAPEMNPECEHNARLNLGDTLLALGRLEEAEAQFRIVEQVARNPQPRDRYMLWRYAQHLFHSYGEVWLARGDTDKALAYADECLALAEPTTSRKNIVKGRRLRGQALLAQGRLAEAEWEIDAALQVARQVGNPPQTWKTLVARGDLRRAQGRGRAARAEYQAALAVIDRVAAALTDASLRETFLCSAHVQRIRLGAQGDQAQAAQLPSPVLP